ncbi:MAG TPA: Mut7-C RNAse domain-containing protein [Dehalococcoidia bacterium]|nr:Mut7-C RNAse domain-containing protein [Dehalococcoidia bacterium]
MKFIVDSNVGRLARWLRIAGFDTLFINDLDDNRLVRIALSEGRVLLTKDTQILKRRVAATGRLQVLLIEGEEVKGQLRQVVKTFNLTNEVKPFTLCLECNKPLVIREKGEVEGQVPPYVFQNQTQYMQCPECQRVYWRGTHWERMSRELERIVESA